MIFLPCTNSTPYVKFIKRLYNNDAFHIDFISPLVHEFINGTSPFAKRLWTRAFLIEAASETVGAVLYLIHENAPHLLQVTFAEYLPGRDVAGNILKKAHAIALEKGATEIVLGLNGHLNYGLGYCHNVVSPPSFCSPSTKNYYVQDYRALGLAEHSLSSYTFPWSQKIFPLPQDRVNRLMKRYTFRYMTPSTYKDDLAIYTALNNRCFPDHPFYFQREEDEDQYLFKDLKFFLKKNSLVFAEFEGIPVGFLLWYPDWSEIMKPGETLSTFTAIKRFLFSHKVNTFKIVEWAVLPEHRKKGVPIGMLSALYHIVKSKRYNQCKTSWIFDSNTDSNAFGHKWAVPDHHYSVFSLKLAQDA